jgi:DNA polymerase-3 subunit gamma/tau
MTDLAKKYRPQLFGDIVGQPKADAWFRRQVTSKEALSVLLSGPYGTGKTSLGLLYAKALFCKSPEDGEPCGMCDRCKEFGDIGRGFLDFHRFECGENRSQELSRHGARPPLDQQSARADARRDSQSVAPCF